MSVTENILLSLTSTFDSAKISKVSELAKQFGDFNISLTFYLILIGF